MSTVLRPVGVWWVGRAGFGTRGWVTLALASGGVFVGGEMGGCTGVVDGGFHAGGSLLFFVQTCESPAVGAGLSGGFVSIPRVQDWVG